MQQTKKSSKEIQEKGFKQRDPLLYEVTQGVNMNKVNYCIFTVYHSSVY